MRVIIEQKAGSDYPTQYRWDPTFRESQERAIRRRLELRSTDLVEIREVS